MMKSDMGGGAAAGGVSCFMSSTNCVPSTSISFPPNNSFSTPISSLTRSHELSPASEYVSSISSFSQTRISEIAKKVSHMTKSSPHVSLPDRKSVV